MNTSLSILALADGEYIRAACDAQLSLPETRLLATLLAEEDQHDYNQLLQSQLTDHVHHILQKLNLLLQVSLSAQWTAAVLVKKVIIHQQQQSLDLLTVVACVTLACKYQDSSPQPVNYELIADCCQIDNIDEIHDAELHLLDLLSWDVCATTPDHFFSYLSNVASDDNNLKQVIQEVRSHQTHPLLHNYPCSIVALSLMFNHNSSANTFILDQIKCFLHQKKNPAHYCMQLLNCTAQLQGADVGTF